MNSLINKELKKFKELLTRENHYRILTHLDADGISSGSIMSLFLKNQGKTFHLSVIEQLTDEHINELKSQGPPLILLDFGSGQLAKLKHLLDKRVIIILDHHEPQSTLEHENLIHVNPCLAGVDGGSEVSASGVTYLFLKELGVNSLSASIALVGASGDLQNLESPYNSSIIKDSSLTTHQDLNLYGLNTRAIHKALEYSDLVPGLSNDETACVNFLTELGIKLKDGSDWRTINDLTSDEKQRLISAVIVKRSDLEKPEDIFKRVYELEIGYKRSLNEWAALLNACGRMNLPSMGVNALINPDFKHKIEVVLKEYRNQIATALNWLESNRENESVVKETEHVLYFIAREEVNHRIIGTICSINSFNSDKEFIVGFADSEDMTKVSIRRLNSELKASDLVIDAVKGLGEGGGHAQAAGANIKKGREAEFIDKFEKVLKRNKV